MKEEESLEEKETNIAFRFVNSDELQNSFDEIDTVVLKRKPCRIHFINYLTGFFTLGYYTLIIPFRLKRIHKNGKFEIHTNIIQKTLCGIVQIILLFDFVSRFWIACGNDKGGSNFSYFTSLTYIGYVAYHLSLNFTFWFKKSTFATIFYRIQDLKFYSPFSVKYTKLFMSVISITFCSVILLMALTENTIVNQLYKHWDFGKYYEYLSHEAKLHFLFDDSSGRGSEPDCYLEIFVTALRISLLLPSMLLVPFLDVLLLLVPFCLWRIMCSFERFCRNNIGGPEATARIMQTYWEIKALIKEINKGIGLILCCCVSVSLPYYATWSAVTYFKESVHAVTLLHVYGFFIVFFLALALAADVNKKGTDFYCWISSPQHNAEVPLKVLTSLLVDFHANEVALKGKGFFQISYRFLGTILGVIITYSIITIQVQLSRQVVGNSGWNCTIDKLSNN